MRLHLLGSSAGKPVPRPFCSCRVCRRAREMGGRDVRTRTGLQIYPRETAADRFLRPQIQVDLSPDFVHQIIRDRIDPSGLEHLLITHPDADHLHVEYLATRRTVLSPVDELPILHLYGNAFTEEAVTRALSDLDKVRCRFHRIEDGDTFRVGPLQVTAFRAQHRGPRCLHYAIDDGQHKVLLAWDGLWDEEIWARLRAWRFSAIGLECTHFGPADADGASHLNLRQFLRTRDRLRAAGALGDASRLFAVHIGDNGGLTYDEAAALAAKEAFIVGYDGMVLDL